jgi:hypothetical protein
VVASRQQGMKTEPAFAAALELKGDPYLALLDLGQQNDQILISVLLAGGFAGTAMSESDAHASQMAKMHSFVITGP